jgi:hypothetical protein
MGEDELIHMSQNRDLWWAVVNIVMTLEFLNMVGIF